MDISILSPEGALNQALTHINDYMWTYLLIGMLLLCALFFTIRTRFVQFRMLGHMCRLLVEGTPKKGQKQVSSFQAFAISVATRVGTGNLAGVATAIAVGGPGAVFWMWLIALLGAATAFVESTLAQLFKVRGKHSFIGGPAFYMQLGLKKKWMGQIFAVLITLTFGLSFNSIQSNTICASMQNAFNFDPILVGIILVILASLIVFGGIHRIARVSGVIVPVMAICYFILAFWVVASNFTRIPDVMSLIFSSAFGFRQAAGGAVGAAMMNGIKRGLFSNEAGEGSAPNAAATAATSHPVKQGLIQALGVFTDTILVCSCTAFIILFSGLGGESGLNGVALTQSALEVEIGAAGPVFVAIAILFFAFSSIIGNYYYGEANILFLTRNKTVMTIYRIFSAGVMVIFGALASLDLAWSLGDVFMALMTLCNLIAIILLCRYVFLLLDDYQKQRKAGIKSPVFRKSNLKGVDTSGISCWDEEMAQEFEKQQ